MEKIQDRFIRYTAIHTESKADVDTVPSTPIQFELAKLLRDELTTMGYTARMDGHCYVYGEIPANNGKESPVLGLIAHMDTSPDITGKNVKARIVPNYDGGDVVLSEEKGIVLSPAEFDSLARHIGEDLIVTDGTTLLGADDKAGIAEIMALAEYLAEHPEVSHGPIRIAFTPDEEVGNGPAFFDVKGFGADFGYTLDGGRAGEIEYENFNAATLRVHVTGRNIHPGSAKGKMKNAIAIGMEFDSLLPADQRPQFTSGYEGFFHLNDISGTVEGADLLYIVRDHDAGKMAEKKALAEAAGRFLNEKYGSGTVEVSITDSYRNMKEQILPHMHLIDNAKAVMEELGIEPVVIPIRGGTDGARLSFMGLPCPNLCAGGENAHGRYEYTSVQALEKCFAIALGLVKKYGA